MQHKGEIIEKAIRESGISITRLADKMGKSRRWMYQLFDKQNVPTDYILEIGKLIHYDFTDEIKELKAYKRSISIMDTSRHENSPEYWKNKYLDLLEKHNILLQKINEK